MGLQALLYSPLREDEKESTEGWEKDSIQYAITHRNKIIRFIKNLGKSANKQSLQHFDAEDIYGLLIEQLYKSADYSLSLASERSKTGDIVSLEGYVLYQAKCCFRRFNTETYERTKDIVKDYINDSEGKELSALDSVEDVHAIKDYEDVMYSIEESCKQFQCYRYKYGVDIYMLFYIRLLTMIAQNNGEVYKDILETLGISKKELTNIENKSGEDEVIRTLASAISVSGLEKSIQTIERYVYSASNIKEFALQYC